MAGVSMEKIKRIGSNAVASAKLTAEELASHAKSSVVDHHHDAILQVASGKSVLRGGRALPLGRLTRRFLLKSNTTMLHDLKAAMELIKSEGTAAASNWKDIQRDADEFLALERAPENVGREARLYASLIDFANQLSLGIIGREQVRVLSNTQVTPENIHEVKSNLDSVSDVVAHSYSRVGDWRMDLLVLEAAQFRRIGVEHNPLSGDAMIDE
jgi:hypothetical protein